MSIATLERVTPPVPADIAHFSVTGIYRGNLRTDVTARQFSIPVAEPPELGGDDSAPNPMELLLAALDGCLAVVIEVVAAEHGATLKSIDLASEGTLDTRGFLGTADVPAFFRAVHTRIKIEVDLPPESFAAFTRTVERRCPAGTLIEAAGVNYTVDWIRL